MDQHNFRGYNKWFSLWIFVIFLYSSNVYSTEIGNIHTPEVIKTDEDSEYATYFRTKRDLLEQRNRDGYLPNYPLEPDLRIESSYILDAHEILRKGLQKFLGFKETDLGTYLSYLIKKRTEPFVDEYGHVIRNYKKVFRFIWEQYNETLVQNYAIGQFNKDKLDLCSVARYLSHQRKVEHRSTIMKIMGDALSYRCHPCTPYTPKQYDETYVPSTDDIHPEGVSPEESFVLCKGHQIQVDKDFSTSPNTSKPSGSLATEEFVEPTLLSFDYSPCKYSNGGVLCDRVNIQEVQRVLRRTSIPTLASIKIILKPYTTSETFIPEDVLGNKRALQIWLEYPSRSLTNLSLSLQVDPNAFRSTKNYTKTLTFYKIDCSLLDLSSFSGFDKLTNVTFSNVNNIHVCLPSLPHLPLLDRLVITHCMGMNELRNFPTLTNGLKMVIFIGTSASAYKMYTDETVDRITNWLLLSSGNTLEEMTVQGMKRVTQVPQKLASFKALRKLWLIENNISTIKNGSFSFTAPVTLLNLDRNGIVKIEADAFQGDFRDAIIGLNGNNLTTFEESVFSFMLEQMASTQGEIRTKENPIDCNSEMSICNLAWLRRHKRGFDLNCSNGTSFDYLQLDDFNHCPTYEKFN